MFEEPEPDLSDLDALVQQVENQAALLVAVATGGPRIDDVQGEYKRRRQSLRPALRQRGLDYPFPWADLWQWYGYWSANLVGYASRRSHIRELVTPTLEALERQGSGLAVSVGGTGQLAAWVDLDARVAGLASELAEAVSQDDLQDVGRRAREVLIDCGKLLAEPALVPAGAVAPKAADAKAWLDLFLETYADGSSRAELRRLVRAAWDLAQKVTHGDLGRTEAYAAAQTTVLIVRVLQELASGRT